MLLLGSITGVEAASRGLVCNTMDGGTRWCSEPVGNVSVDMVVTNPYTQRGFIATKNCSTGRFSWRSNTGYTQGDMDRILLAACEYHY